MWEIVKRELRLGWVVLRDLWAIWQPPEISKNGRASARDKTATHPGWHLLQEVTKALRGTVSGPRSQNELAA